MIATELPSTLQQLIDARLDNIERALMTNGTDRSDRRQIVSGIEDQIMEMISEIDATEPTRDDVLAVLAKLDPPEAYLNFAETDFSRPFARADRSDRVAVTPSATQFAGRYNTLALVALGLACLACLGSFTWWILAYFGLIPLAVVTIAATVCGIVAICQLAQNNNSQRGLWMAIVACCSMPVVLVLSYGTLIVIESL